MSKDADPKKEAKPQRCTWCGAWPWEHLPHCPVVNGWEHGD